MTVSTKNKKSVLRALEGSGVKWNSGKTLKEIEPCDEYLGFNCCMNNTLTYGLKTGNELSDIEFVGHVWREMAKAKEVKPDDDFHQDDPADLRAGDLCYVSEYADRLEKYFNSKKN